MIFQLLTIAGVFLLSVASPGPNFAMVTSTAMRVSRRAGMFAGLGLAAASCTWTLLVIAGVGIILTQAPWIYQAIKIIGALYLIWIGLKMLLSARKPIATANSASASGIAAFRKAYFVSMTNPKSVAFYGSILTVMVPASAPAWFYAAIMAITILVSGTWYCGLALLFSHRGAQRIFARAKTGIEITMGAILIGLGGRMLAGR
jgi:threonine/homoserine/homoserine lactone efflux protein